MWISCVTKKICKTKLPQSIGREIKRVASQESRLIVVPRIAEVVPVHVGLNLMTVEIRHVEIAIVVPDEHVHHHLFHHPLKDKSRAWG